MTEEMIQGFSESLGQELPGYSVTFGDEVAVNPTKGYRRVTIQNKGESMVLDLRLGPPSASAAEPAIIVRGKGGVEYGSELYVTSKLVPETNEYGLKGPRRAFADIVKASFESAREARLQHGLEGRSAEEEFYAYLTQDTESRLDKFRSKYNITLGYQQTWGSNVPGEQQFYGKSISVFLRREPQDPSGRDIKFDQEIEKITKQIVEGSLGRSLVNRGYYIPVQSSPGIYHLAAATTAKEVLTSGGQKELMAYVLRGLHGEATTPANLLKFLKSQTLWARSRQEAFPLTREAMTGLYVPMEGTTIDAWMAKHGISPESFGKTVMAENVTPGYVTGRAIWPGEEKPRLVRFRQTLIGPTGTHSGAGIIPESEYEDVSAVGTLIPGETYDLPFRKKSELYPEEGDALGLIKNINSRIIPAGAPAIHIAEGVDIASKPYARQIQATRIIIPRYMDENTGVFYPSREAAPMGASVITTEQLAADLMTRYRKFNLTVERSGMRTPMLEFPSIGIVGAEEKGIAGLKQGMAVVARKSLDFFSGKQKYHLRGITPESKSVIETFVSSWDMQPTPNQISLLSMAHPELGTWAAEVLRTGNIRLEDVAKKWAELSGLPAGQYHYTEPFRVILNKLRNAGPEERKLNFLRYGIDTDPRGQISLGKVTPEYVRKIQGLGKKIMAEENIPGSLEDYMKFKRVGDMYEHIIKARPGSSMIMPVGVGIAPMWPAESEEINLSGMIAIENKFPEYARKVGLQPEQGPAAGRRLRARAAWQNVFMAYMYGRAATRGDVRFSEEHMLSVTQELSAQIMNIIQPAEYMSPEEKMKEIRKLAGDKVLFFPGSQTYLPGAGAITTLERFDPQGDPKYHMSTQYLSALAQLAHGEESGDLGPGITAAWTSFIGGKESTIGKKLSSGGDLLRRLYGRGILGSIGGRYLIMNELKPGEAFIPTSELKRMARSMGMRSKDEIQQLLNYIDEKGEVPAIFWRYPHLSETEGAAGVKLISERRLIKERGIDPRKLKALSPGLVFMNPFTIEPFIGDEDQDPFGIMIGLTRDPSDKSGIRDILSEEESYVKDVQRDAEQLSESLSEIVGRRHTSTFSTMEASLRSFLKGETPISTIEEAGYVSGSTLQRSASQLRSIETRRATSYQTIQAWRIAASIMGLPDDVIRRAEYGLPGLYQRTLEWNELAAQMSPLENIMQTTRFGAVLRNEPRKYWSLKLMAATSRLPWFSRKTRQGGREETYGIPEPYFPEEGIWESGTRGAGYESYPGLMRTLFNSVSRMTEATPELLAASFASAYNPQTGKRDNQVIAENYRKVLAALSGKDQKQWGDIMWRMLQSGEVGPMSTVGLMVLGQSATRTLFKSETESELRTITSEPTAFLGWGRERYTLENFAEIPEVAAFASMYAAATGRSKLESLSGIPDPSQIEAALAAAGGARGGTARTLRGVLEWSGWQKATQIRKTGGYPITDEELKRALYEGDVRIHASTLSAVLANKEFKHVKLAETIAGWIGSTFHEPSLQKIKLQLVDIKERGKQQFFMGLGNIFQEQVGTREMMKGEQGLIAIPGLGESTGPMEYRFGKTTVLGLPDFLSFESRGGQEYLGITELKLGKGSFNQAIWQAKIYAAMMVRLGRTAEGREHLRKTVLGWMQWYQESFDTRGQTWRPGFDPEDVANRVVALAQAGRVLSRGGHGDIDLIARNARILEETGTNLNLYEEPLWSPWQQYNEKMDDTEAVIDQAMKDIRASIPSYTRLLHGLSKTGKVFLGESEYQMEEKRFPVSHSTMSAIKERIFKYKYFAGAGGGSINPPGSTPVPDPGESRRTTGGPDIEIFARSEDIKLLLEHTKVTAQYMSHIPDLVAAMQDLGPIIQHNAEITQQSFKDMMPSAEQQAARNFFGGRGRQRLDIERVLAAEQAVTSWTQLTAEMGGGEPLLAPFQTAAKAVGAAIPATYEDAQKQLYEYAGNTQYMTALGRGKKDLSRWYRMASSALRGGAQAGWDDFVMTEKFPQPLRDAMKAMRPIIEGADAEGQLRLIEAGYLATGRGDIAAEIIRPTVRERAIAESGMGGDYSKRLATSLNSLEKVITENSKVVQGQTKVTKDLSDQITGSTKAFEREGKVISYETQAAAARQKLIEQGATFGAEGEISLPPGFGAPGEEGALGIRALEDYISARQGIAGEQAGAVRERVFKGFPEKLGRGLRGLLGGFGFYYLQRTMALAFGGLATGYQESEDFGQRLSAQLTGIYGAEAAPLRGSQVAQYQRALIRAGGPGGALGMQYRLATTGTGLGDIVNVGKAGLGTFAAGTFVAAEFGQAITPLLPALSVGAATAMVGVVGLQQVAMARQADQTANRLVAAGMQQKEIGTYGRPLSGLYREWLSQPLQRALIGGDTDWLINPQAQVLAARLNQPVATPSRITGVVQQRLSDEIATLETNYRSRLTERFISGRMQPWEIKGLSPREQTAMINIIAQNPNIWPNVSAETLPFLAATIQGGIQGPQAGVILQNMQAGIDYGGIATGIAGATGVPTSPSMIGTIIGAAPTSPQELAELTLGIQQAQAFTPGYIRRTADLSRARYERAMMSATYGGRRPSGQPIATIGGRDIPSYNEWMAIEVTRLAQEQYSRLATSPARQLAERENALFNRAQELAYPRARPPMGIDEILALSPAQRQARWRGQELSFQAMQQYSNLSTRLGESALWYSDRYEAAMASGLTQMGYGYQAGGELAAQLSQFMPQQAATTAGQAISVQIGGGYYGGQAMMQGLLQGDFNAMYRAYQHFPTQVGPILNQIGGVGALPVDINPYTGNLTGMSWGTSNWSPQIAEKAWGPSWNQSWMSRFVFGAQNMPGAGGVSGKGYTPIFSSTGKPLFGDLGAQAQLSDRMYSAQMAGIGIAMQQVAMQRSFMTGVGISAYSGIVNPQTGKPFGFGTGNFGWNIEGVGSFKSTGGGFWGLEDAMRSLQYAQTEYGFKQQRAGAEMQSRQFYENMGLNQQQAMMQRGWSRADWAFQDQTRGLQWQWRTEDFQEQLRFMGGRERRLATRQMRRETIMHGLEGEQIDTQRQRQEELWKLEDERFKLAREQHEEQKKFQLESIDMQERFYQERRKLEEEQVKMQRAYAIKQLELQEAALGAQAAAAAAQQEYNTKMMELKAAEAEHLETLKQESIEWGIALKIAQSIADVIANMKPPSGGGWDEPEPPGPPPGNGQICTPNDTKTEGDRCYKCNNSGTKWVQITCGPRAAGGVVDPGGVYTVNEYAPEFFKSPLLGTVIPLQKMIQQDGFRPTMDAWNNAILPSRRGGGSNTPVINLTVQLGDEDIANYFIRAFEKTIRV